RTPADIESERTKALLVNGRMSWKMRERLLAPAGVLPIRPKATAIQVSAKVNSATRPSAASQARGLVVGRKPASRATPMTRAMLIDRKSTRLNSSHGSISYAVFCLKKKKKKQKRIVGKK